MMVGMWIGSYACAIYVQNSIHTTPTYKKNLL